MDSLYKGKYPQEVASSDQARMAEYPSIPLTVVTDDGTIVHTGEDVRLDFVIPSTKIENEVIKESSVSYDITFRKPFLFIAFADVVTLRVQVDYNYNSSILNGSEHGIKLTIEQLASGPGMGQSAGIYVGNEKIGTAYPSKNRQIVGTYTSFEKYPADLRSLRYTERHGSQLAYELYLARGDIEKATKLYNELTAYGYTPHKDIYSPLFGMDVSFSDNYQYEGGANGVYRDCFFTPPPTLLSYQYTSKICTFGVSNYILASHRTDWLVPTLWAIHILNKYGEPDSEYNDGDKSWSPREVARYLETKFIDDTGIASPFNADIASSVRTASFLVLETVLGYRYGDDLSMQYADKTAKILLATQIADDGTFVTTLNSDPANPIAVKHSLGPLAGSYYTAWDKSFHYVSVSTVQRQLLDFFNQPDESPDPKPTNMETTAVVSQSLRVYGCYSYHSMTTATLCVNVP